MFDFQKLPLEEIKSLYAQGGNIMEFLRKRGADPAANTLESILVSYDFQAGSYTRDLQNNIEAYDKYAAAIVQVLNPYITSETTMLDAGTGEATTMSLIWDRLKQKPKKVYGFDLSWSRIKQAKKFVADKAVREYSQLMVGDLFHTPFADKSIDIVYTCHAIEPNSGRELEAIRELSRVAKKFLIMFEPGFEFASEAGRARMKSHGYITDIKKNAEALGLQIIAHQPLGYSLNPLSPTTVTVVKIEESKNFSDHILSCPITRQPLELGDGHYFSHNGFFVYPEVKGIPCLLPNYAILATQYEER